MLQAEHDNDKMLLIPLRRELEQLRSQKFIEGQFGEIYQRMDAERKELRKELGALETKYITMLDDYAVRSYIVTINQ